MIASQHSVQIVHVLFLDIVGYSCPSTFAQARLLARLNSAVTASPDYVAALNGLHEHWAGDIIMSDEAESPDAVVCALQSAFHSHPINTPIFAPFLIARLEEHPETNERMVANPNGWGGYVVIVGFMRREIILSYHTAEE